MRTLLVFITAFFLCCNPGCAPPASKAPGTGSGSAESSSGPADDAAAVTALEGLGAKLKKSGSNIREVDFRGTSIDDSALAHLAGLPKLRTVVLSGTDVTDAGVAELAKLSTVDSLDLRQCKLTNAVCESLGKMSKLRALRFTGPKPADEQQGGATPGASIDDEGLAAFSNLKNLKLLSLDYLWISADGLSYLKDLDKLQELYLGKTLVDDEALALLGAEFSQVTKLRVSGSQISTDGLAHLANLQELQHLDLSENSKISDAGLEHIAANKKLTRLNLWRVAITDIGAASLAGLTKMQWLNLDNTQITDASLKHLSDMQDLTFLHLGSTAVTDAGLPHLAGLKSLKDLKVTRTGVTAAGVESLKSKLPNTEIQLKYINRQ